MSGGWPRNVGPSVDGHLGSVFHPETVAVVTVTGERSGSSRSAGRWLAEEPAKVETWEASEILCDWHHGPTTGLSCCYGLVCALVCDFRQHHQDHGRRRRSDPSLGGAPRKEAVGGEREVQSAKRNQAGRPPLAGEATLFLTRQAHGDPSPAQTPPSTVHTSSLHITFLSPPFPPCPPSPSHRSGSASATSSKAERSLGRDSVTLTPAPLAN